MNRPLWLITLALLSVPLVASTAQAIPALQLYLEGAEWDKYTETWVVDGSSSGSYPIRLWAIGNTSSESLVDVRLSIAYAATERTYSGTTITSDLRFTLTPSTTRGYWGFTDDSIPDADPLTDGYQMEGDLDATSYTDPWHIGDPGEIPVLTGGKELPNHGQFGPGIVWQEFMLGDFTIRPPDSPIADFIGSGSIVPTTTFGQINVYEIWVRRDNGDDVHGVQLHFDLYDHYESRTKGKFAPFSHDAAMAPAPSTWVGLLSMGVLGVIAYGRRRFKLSTASSR
ncbi:MAG: choice-of-anchor N protein [Thermoguttaceae bacterium]|nr:choice-of-anchor N protein [Thermoguttaceae bacterium]